MPDKQLTYSEEARTSLMRGVDELSRVVGLTLGPSGRNVLFSRMFGLPVVCSDGVTIAKEIELPDAYENMGAQLVKEAASKTNDVVGDGTTTSVVLTRAIVRQGFLNVAAGTSGMALKSGIEKAVETVVAELKKMAIPVENRGQVARVAALSAHEEAIAQLLADAMDKVGREGVITIEESKALEDELEVVEGVRIDRGYLSPHFVTDTDAEVQAVKDYVASQGAEAVLSRHWELGSAGSAELAEKVVETIDKDQADFATLYPDAMPLADKINTIATKIYRADGAVMDQKILNQLKDWEEQGYGDLPVCMAKTQYSFTTDPEARGAPTGFTIPVREVRLSAGAGFVVAICGEIMTMPGLPRVPSAENIRLNDIGDVEGLF